MGGSHAGHSEGEMTGSEEVGEGHMRKSHQKFIFKKQARRKNRGDMISGKILWFLSIHNYY